MTSESDQSPTAKRSTWRLYVCSTCGRVGCLDDRHGEHEHVEVVSVAVVREVLYQHDIDARHIHSSEAAWDRLRREVLEPAALDQERKL